ncbi:peptidylprolyl isomerase [Clostridium cellulovorans]|uniref:PpiC-type peptidyl-prolyl cis-trans isomerase n=1 Tax=Clostridium cellulovorans (strain ATCC 35296 / DSM 3052 / OCM 3 / 743B) TaxID=573061 RepID=D9SNN7_CLOC7|nr:peptidylprolyl isomerase [Clostridium cellulovorans]ADL49908.1 PpiC-type peptidyl-prolyl cis-trans isomerase [Clostridium cellulovorans 743B]
MDNKVLAVVKNKEITEQNINELIVRMPDQQRMYYDTEQGRARLLEELVSVEVFYNYALELKLDESPAFLEQLEGAKRQMLFPIAADEVTKDVEIADQDVADFYKNNRELFKKPELATASHILVDSEEKAQEIKAEIEAGLSFADAAAKYSTCPSNQRGGDLGQFQKGQMVPEFEEVAFTLPINKLSDPVKTQFGYHLIKVTDFQPEMIQDFDEVQVAIKEKMLQDRRQYKFLEKVDELKKLYNVEYK